MRCSRASIKPRIEIRGNHLVVEEAAQRGLASIKPRIEIRGNFFSVLAILFGIRRFNKAANRNSRKLRRSDSARRFCPSFNKAANRNSRKSAQSPAVTVASRRFNKAANRNSRKSDTSAPIHRPDAKGFNKAANRNSRKFCVTHLFLKNAFLLQ